MSFIQSFIYGAVQGITELLPISSSGHLIVFNKIVNSEPSILSLTFLHLASGIALIIVYFKDILKIIKQKNYKYIFKIVIASIPVVLIGVLFSDYIDEVLYKIVFVAINSIIWGLIMILTDSFVKPKNTKLHLKNAVMIGIMQVLSLIPGTSRSGVTSLTGVWSGLSKEKALKFTFLMGIFLLFGTFSFEVLKNYKNLDFNNFDFIAFLSAFIFSLIAGFIMKKISRNKFFLIFGIYRIIFGIALFFI